MPHDRSEELVVRFSRWARVQHAAVIVLFVVLLVTGMPQKWPNLDISQWTVDALGGIFAVRWYHRAAGLVFSLLLVGHLLVAVGHLLRSKETPSMLLIGKDFRDAYSNLRYYLGRTEVQPRFGRYDYRQKFEYWGLIFGSLIMALSGVILYAPLTVSRLLFAELIPAAKEAHTNEALLAFAIIVIWHIYGAHLNPETFPADTSIFSGRISRERLRREHPLEYEERFPEPSAPVDDD